jgi:hypothetical protein
MATQEVKRKLTAILSADVKGYSRASLAIEPAKFEEFLSSRSEKELNHKETLKCYPIPSLILVLVLFVG